MKMDETDVGGVPRLTLENQTAEEWRWHVITQPLMDSNPNWFQRVILRRKPATKQLEFGFYYMGKVYFQGFQLVER